jgi:hypothetical protein
MIELLEAAREVQDFCERLGWRFCFIGGLAVLRWGETRVTLDVDLDILTGFGGEDEVIDALLGGFASRLPGAREFAQRNRVLLLQTAHTIGIDVSLAALPFEELVIQRASPFTYDSGVELLTCSAEDLIVLKLFASRPLDIRDVEGVAIRNRGRLDWGYIEEQLTPLAELKYAPEIINTLARIREL